MSDYQTLFFDLDGTLTDPKIGITRSVQHALNTFGIHEENLDNLTLFIGPPLPASFREYYGLSDEQITQAVIAYRERFSTIGLYENELLPGIPELLQQLKERGIRLFVATSKPTIYAQQILAHFQLDQYFEFVSGSNPDETGTDKAAVIAEILHRYPEIDVHTTAMIGDRKFDVIGAQMHSIDAIAVDYGYAPPHELEQTNPTYHVATVQELTDLLLAHTSITIDIM